jgi:hypothetical protein
MHDDETQTRKPGIIASYFVRSWINGPKSHSEWSKWSHPVDLTSGTMSDTTMRNAAEFTIRVGVPGDHVERSGTHVISCKAFLTASALSRKHFRVNTIPSTRAEFQNVGDISS